MIVIAAPFGLTADGVKNFLPRLLLVNLQLGENMLGEKGLSFSRKDAFSSFGCSSGKCCLPRFTIFLDSNRAWRIWG